MDYRIIALDLDGTLLTSDKRLSAVNRAALESAAAKGALIVPTTGRFFGMMPAPVRDLPFVRYAITINGAQVYDRVTDAAIVREELPLELAREIMGFLDGFDVIYDCYRGNWGWMTASAQARAETYATDEHYLKMLREFRRPVADLRAHLAATASEGDVQKIMIFTRRTGGERVRAELAEALAARYPQVTVTSSTRNNIEINAAGAHKGAALGRFAAHLGLSLDACLAFGDGLNDLTMIAAAGMGVAMANAEARVKAVAKHVTLTNDEDGVAVALRRFGF